MATEPLIVIGTPCYGTPDTASVSAAYHMAVANLVRDSHFRLLPAVYGCDLVRGRSRLVRQFLETRATHLLFWDEDISLTAEHAGRLIARMVEADHAFVACTYPKKKLQICRAIRALGEATAEELRHRAVVDALYDYAYRSETSHPCVRGCVEVDGLPLGFALATRDMLATMVDRYRGTLGFGDVVDGVTTPTVALFQLVIDDGRLLGEDYSFSRRWRDIGGACQLYVGADCELVHIGKHAFEASRGGYAAR